MKVSREQAAENRERVIDIASRIFRERGFQGIGVADIMKEAGLTHGAFYGQFTSKEDLMEKATMRAFDGADALWAKLAADAPEDPVGAITAQYLSTKHRDHPELGCVVAALGPELARQPEVARRTMTSRISTLLDVLVRYTPGRTRVVKRERALAAYASMIGALVIARAVTDEALSEEILAAVQKSINTKT